MNGFTRRYNGHGFVATDTKDKEATNAIACFSLSSARGQSSAFWFPRDDHSIFISIFIFIHSFVSTISQLILSYKLILVGPTLAMKTAESYM